MSHLYTDRGFLIYVPDQHISKGAKWYANPAINELHHQKHDHLVDQRSWEWRAQAIELCLSMLMKSNPGMNFFSQQIYSDKPLPFRAVDFLFSTLTFIKTGTRKMVLENWYDLLDVHPDVMAPLSNTVIADFEREFGALLHLPESDLLVKWLAHPNGLDDLVGTCRILFGDNEVLER